MEYEKGEHSHCGEEILTEDICNPLFWQALGKACGWREDQVMGSVSVMYSLDESKRFGDITWQYHALRFHEINLTEDWSVAVDYLRSVCEIEK